MIKLNQIIIKKYITKLTKQNIIDYLNNQQIKIPENEIDIVYHYIKNNQSYFIEGNHQKILKELKEKLSNNTYNSSI